MAAPRLCLFFVSLWLFPRRCSAGFWQAAIVSPLVGCGAKLRHGVRASLLLIRLPILPTPSRFSHLFLPLCWSAGFSARVNAHATEAESWGGQMHDLYEFTRRTLQMNVNVEPGAQAR